MSISNYIKLEVLVARRRLGEVGALVYVPTELAETYIAKGLARQAKENTKESSNKDNSNKTLDKEPKELE
jgi:hypothetical protein